MASSEGISSRRRCTEATVRTAQTDADSLERTQLMRTASSWTVRSGLTPCPGRYRFWVTSSCLALRGIPRSHCAFVRQLVRSSPDRETYTTANPPSSATSRRENCAAPTEMTREKKGHHESPRADDDAGTGNLAGTCDARIEWKWSGGGDDARRCRDVERYNNRNRLRFHYFHVQIGARAECRLLWLTALGKYVNYVRSYGKILSGR